MQEDIVMKLTNFGFTVNQAKVYLSIIQSGPTRVGKISRNTQLHRQDIYKLLPKLEKMGLITKTIDKPFMIEAISVEKALDNLISKERRKANDKITCLEKSLKEMISALQEQPERKEEARFTLLTTDDAIMNRINLSFRRVKRAVNLVTNLEILNMPIMHYYQEFLQTLANTKVKASLLIVTNEKKELVNQAVEKMAPSKGDFTAKHIDKNVFKHYQIIDRREVWIATQQRTESGFPCILWTNDQNIVEVYVEHLKKAWNHTRANVVYSNSLAKPFITQINDGTLMPSAIVS